MQEPSPAHAGDRKLPGNTDAEGHSWEMSLQVSDWLALNPRKTRWLRACTASLGNVERVGAAALGCLSELRSVGSPAYFLELP